MKVAIPTDDGIRVAPRFWRVSTFLVADVSPGDIGTHERRQNLPRTQRARPRTAIPRPPDRYLAVADILSDCRVVIAGSMGDAMRRALNVRGIEVVITSEDLLDRVLALFSLAMLRDESRMDPEDAEIAEAAASGMAETRDDFDG